MLNKQTISSKLTICGLVILLIFLGDLKFKQYMAENQIQRQEQSLQQQADALQKKNDQLSQSLQYLNSPDFKESVAREQLGLKKQGESVYSFGSTATAQNTSQSPTQAPSNLQKWWNYFFSSNN